MCCSLIGCATHVAGFVVLRCLLDLLNVAFVLGFVVVDVAV